MPATDTRPQAPAVIVFIITALHVGGAEMMLLKLLSRIDRRRFSPIVIALGGGGTLASELARQNVPGYDLGMSSAAGVPGALVRLARLVRSLRPDLIQGWMYHGNVAAQWASAFVPGHVPVLWNIRGTVINLRREPAFTAATIWLGARLSRLPRVIVNNSTVSAQRHTRELGYSSHNVVTIPNGFDVERFAPRPADRERLRASLGVAPESFLLGHVGRLHPMKDHETLIRAVALARQTMPHLRLVMVGADVADRSRKLAALAGALGVSDRVDYLGAREDVAPILSALDLATLTSSYGEGFPNAVGEAMACGVPCVVTDVGDSAHVVGDTGITVTPGDPAALARAWTHFSELTSAQTAASRQAARERIVREFSLDAVVHRYQDLYESCLTGAVRPGTAPRQPGDLT